MSLLTSIKKKTGNITFLFFLLSLIQIFPLFILGVDTSVQITDVLDVYVSQYKIIASSNYAFCSFDQPANQIMNGLNRDLLVSDLSIIYLLFLGFNSFCAYTLNVLFIKSIAFIGMYVFLKNNFTTFDQKQTAIGAFLFSCIPFFPFFGIGIAGQPLLINTFINFYKKRARYTDYIVLFLFPFYSSLVFTNLFVIFVAGLFCIFVLLHEKRIPFQLVLSLLLFSILGILVEYRLIHAVLTPGFISNRVEFNAAAFITKSGMKPFVDSAIKILTTGIYHVDLFYSWLVVLMLCISIFNWQKLKASPFFLKTIASIIAIALLYGLVHSSYYFFITEKIHFLKTFQVDRFYTLLPFLYFLLTAICIQHLLQTNSVFRKKMLTIAVTLSCIVLFLNSYSLKSIFTNNQKGKVHSPSYAEFYDATLFSKVQSAIPLAPSEYRTVSVGLEPDVLLYNGFYNLDGYLNIYPLDYKKRFRSFTEGELMKSDDLKKYFDDWGNRCYAFSSEIGKRLTPYKKDNTFINDLRFNTSALKQLTEKPVYLISTRQIKNADAIGIELVQFFQSKEFYRNIALYKVL
jgi:hypothetical protein